MKGLTLNKAIWGVTQVGVFAGTLLPRTALAVDPAATTCPTGVANDATNLTINQGVDCAKGKSNATTLFGDGGVFSQISNILIFLIGAVAVIMLIVGGFRYVVSGGDKTAVESAKSTILYAIIGIVVAILAYAAVAFVTGSLAPATPS